jgi:hypothetical protein
VNSSKEQALHELICPVHPLLSYNSVMKMRLGKRERAVASFVCAQSRRPDISAHSLTLTD